MKILVVTPFFPSTRHGGGTRLLRTIEYLARNHEITLMSGTRHEDKKILEDVERLCSKIIYCDNLSEKIGETIQTDAPQRRPFPRRIAGVMVRKTFPRIWALYLEIKPENLSDLPAHISRYYSADIQNKLRKLFEQERFDIVDLEWTEHAIYADDIPEDCIKVFTCHEVNTPAFYRMAMVYQKGWFNRCKALIQWWKMRRFEREYAKHFDVIVALSPRDHRFLQKATNGKVCVPLIPTGVPLEIFPYANCSNRELASAVFLGTYKTLPNREAVRFFLGKIYPRVKRRLPDFKVYFVGADPTDEMLARADGENIIVTGFVDDFMPYLHKGTVFIVPIRMGGGIKGKIIEAMAAGIPVLSTPQGCEGIKVTPGENIIVARGARAFASKFVWMTKNPDVCSRLSRNGRALVERIYDWEKNVAELENVLEESVKRKRETLRQSRNL